MMPRAPAARANRTAWTSSGSPPTEMSALGTCSVSAPRRLPSPAASNTACMVRSLLKQIRKRREAPDHWNLGEPEHETLGGEGRRHADERHPFALGDLTVV